MEIHHSKTRLWRLSYFICLPVKALEAELFYLFTSHVNVQAIHGGVTIEFGVEGTV
jgi:hypothetical protein